MALTKEKQQTAFEALKGARGYRNVMESPRLLKVVLSVGTGKEKDKNRIATIQDRLAKISGQHAAARGAKKSIASFKVREGDVVGYQITLHGARMYDFLDRLLHVALPRTRDFRGIPRSVVDEMGNMTIGIREHTIFAETADEDLKDVFGLAITTVTTARGRDEALAFFEHIGLPFKKEGE
jgi:large subunit ribosomal protein L5